jgi:hypothetical protein
MHVFLTWQNACGGSARIASAIVRFLAISAAFPRRCRLLLVARGLTCKRGALEVRSAWHAGCVGSGVIVLVLEIALGVQAAPSKLQSVLLFEIVAGVHEQALAGDQRSTEVLRSDATLLSSRIFTVPRLGVHGSNFFLGFWAWAGKPRPQSPTQDHICGDC